MVHPFCSLEDLTPEELKQLEAESKKWHKRFAARKAAIRASLPTTKDMEFVQFLFRCNR